MLLFRISGTWKGYYEYGESYPKLLRGKRVDFVLNLKEKSNEFIGECIDISESYRDNLTAEVRGFTSGNLISFIKKYPHHYRTKDDGSKEIDYDKKHPEIEYTGYYESESKKFKGEWLMVTRNVFTKHDYSSIIPFNDKVFDQEKWRMKVKEYGHSGTWEIEKE